MEASGQFHAPAALFTGKDSLVPIRQASGWAPGRSELGGDEKNSHTLPGPEPLIIQPVAQRYTTELSRLPYSVNTVTTPSHVTFESSALNARSRQIFRNSEELALNPAEYVRILVTFVMLVTDCLRDM
jgi:hypothetical protein